MSLASSCMIRRYQESSGNVNIIINYDDDDDDDVLGYHSNVIVL